MPLLKAEAEKLSNNDLVAGVIEEIIDRDPLFYLLPFVGTNGKAYVYDRENTLSEADFLDPNDTVNEGAATFTEVTARLRILAGDVDVDKFLQATMSDTNNQKAIRSPPRPRLLLASSAAPWSMATTSSTRRNSTACGSWSPPVARSLLVPARPTTCRCRCLTNCSTPFRTVPTSS